MSWIQKLLGQSGSRHEATYVLAVVTLATYLVALFLFGGTATRYQAQTSVHPHAGHPLAAGTAAEGEPLSALSELLSQEAEAKVLAECGLAQQGAESLRAAQARLSVVVSAQDRPQGDVKIDVRFYDDDAATAAGVAAHVGAAYAAAFSARVDKGLARLHAQARMTADQSDQSYRLADAELRTFLDQALAAMVENLALGTGRPVRAGYFARLGPGASSGVQLASGQTLTPQQRDVLLSQLGELKRERERMLTTMTEQHPDVVRLSGMIADAERRLAAAGPVPAAPAPVIVNPLAPAPPAAAVQPTDGQKLARLQEAQFELAERYAVLSADVATAKAEFEKHAAGEREAFKRYADARGADLAAVETVQAERAIDRPALRQVMLVSLAVALLIGLAAARCVHIAAAQFESVEQLRRELPLPVIEADARLTTQPARGARIARSLAGGAKLAGELVLCAAVIWFGVMAFYESGFAGEFLSDPMGVLAQGISRTGGAMGW
ncbi:MAG: hypothetical protein HYS13_05795 [Planctomycetia bacterium]|nr:hypothetical protein [Planctomycetia bacterium]